MIMGSVRPQHDGPTDTSDPLFCSFAHGLFMKLSIGASMNHASTAPRASTTKPHQARRPRLGKLHLHALLQDARLRLHRGTADLTPLRLPPRCPRGSSRFGAFSARFGGSEAPKLRTEAPKHSELIIFMTYHVVFYSIYHRSPKQRGTCRFAKSKIIGNSERPAPCNTGFQKNDAQV